ncbi:MAG: hypothetical protein GY869_22360, partial [Planctomycetes bacterium]|nr:hypothetical protein [Planctomycetota bacterium]
MMVVDKYIKKFIGQVMKEYFRQIFLILVLAVVVGSCKDEKYAQQEELITSIEIWWEHDIDYQSTIIVKKKERIGESIDLGYMALYYPKESIEKIENDDLDFVIYTETFIMRIGLPSTFEIFCEIDDMVQIDNDAFAYPAGENIVDLSIFGADKQITLTNYTREDFRDGQTYGSYKKAVLTEILKKGEVKKMSVDEFDKYYN